MWPPLYGKRMPRKYKKRQPLITFDTLMQTVSEEFAQLPDHRRTNTSYDLADVLRSAFAMFSLKSPSLLSFREQTKPEQKNLQTIYHIAAIPSDTQMRSALDPVSPLLLRPIFAKLFATLCDVGLLKSYRYCQGHVIVSIDGVQHFSSTKIHCDHCTTRKRRNSTISKLSKMTTDNAAY